MTKGCNRNSAPRGKQKAGEISLRESDRTFGHGGRAEGTGGTGKAEGGVNRLIIHLNWT